MSHPLQAFVHRSDQRTAPPPGQPSQVSLQDRQRAMELKFSANKNIPPPIQQGVWSTAPAAPGYVSKLWGARDTYPPQQYVPQKHGNGFHRGLDETVSSDFDVTKSDVPLDSRRQPSEEDYDEKYGSEDEDTQLGEQEFEGQVVIQPMQPASQHRQHTIKHKYSVSPIVDRKTESQDMPKRSQHPGISGRFEPSQRKSPSLQHRSTLEEPDVQHTKIHRKRTHSLEIERQIKNKGLHLPERHRSRHGHELSGFQSDDVPSEDNLEPEGDNVEHLLLSPSQGRKNQNLQGSGSPATDFASVPDYTDDVLKSMKYSVLETQSWEEVPGAKIFDVPVNFQDTQVTVAEKMKFYLKTDRDTQESFYTDLSIKDWEEAGDYFIEAYTNLMTKLIQKRREKRAVTEAFEKEIMEQEEAVRGKSNKLDTELNTMRTGGEHLLKGKMA